MPILRTVCCFLGSDDILEARHGDLSAKEPEVLCSSREIVVARRAGRLERNVQSAGIGNEVPHVSAPEHRRACIEWQSLRHRLRVHSRLQLTERRGEPDQIRVIACRRDVGIRRDARESVQPCTERTNENESHTVASERAEQALGVERGDVTHA